MVMLVNGEAVPASTTAGGIVVGICQKTVEATAGDTTVNAKRGTFLLNNSGGADEVVTSDVLTDCFIVDDQTVAKTNGGGTPPVAGRIEQVEGSGVWVTFD